jgi:hypothetical protein
MPDALARDIAGQLVQAERIIQIHTVNLVRITQKFKAQINLRATTVILNRSRVGIHEHYRR